MKPYTNISTKKIISNPWRQAAVNDDFYWFHTAECSGTICCT